MQCDNIIYIHDVDFIIYIAMKILYCFFTALLLLVLSCENPNTSDPLDDIDSPKDNIVEGTDGTHCGWHESNPYYGKEYQNGDTVNVRKFIDSDFDGEVWVTGYIIGCATGSGGYKYQIVSPYDYETAILLGDSRWNKKLDYAISIQLANGSKIRRKLNLKNNPCLDGVRIAVKGVKTTYLKLSGMKEITDYKLLESEYGVWY